VSASYREGVTRITEFSGGGAVELRRSDEGYGVKLTAVYRGGEPHYSAPAMIARAIRSAGRANPSFIETNEIVEPRTKDALLRGGGIESTPIGRMLSSSVSQLGGTITGWTIYEVPGKEGLLGVRVEIAYPKR
jgi:hypothetical protein